jgi:molybdate/tungstate transport system ATP-binding protein
MGLIGFSSGSLFIENRDYTRLAVERRNLAIVYQDFALFPHLNVTQNIFYGVRYHKIPKPVAQKRFDFLVSSLGLEKITQRSPQNLSGGEKQRVALARSLIFNPSVLLLDEPLSALDPMFHEEAKLLLKKIHDELETTIIMVSHNFSDVLYLANRGAIIRNGQILQQDDIITIFERPNSKFTASFVGMKNIHPIQVHDKTLIVPDKKTKISCAHTPGDTDQYMGIRPEDISFIDINSNHYGNQYSGRITKISSNGVFLNISLDTGDHCFEAIWSRRRIQDHGLEVGKTLEFGFLPESVHTF